MLEECENFYNTSVCHRARLEKNNVRKLGKTPASRDRVVYREPIPGDNSALIKSC